MNPYQDIPIWSLMKDGKVARAELRYVEGYGYEARLLFNGEFRQGRAFRGEKQGGKAAKEWAEEWKQELEGKGWADSVEEIEALLDRKEMHHE